MAAVSYSLVLSNYSPLRLSPVSAFKSVDQYTRSSDPTNLSFRFIQIGRKQSSTCRKGLTVQTGYRDDGRPGSSSTFIRGFLLGGIIFGTLGCVYAPQISKALLGPEKKRASEETAQI